METITDQWQQRIKEAQQQTTVELADGEYKRIPYGEDYPDGKDQCRDCAVSHGQLHVYTCCVERCPSCKGQLISCGC